MNTLLLDIGNTRLKWTLAHGDAALPAAQALAHQGEPAEAVAQLAVQWHTAAPTAVFIAHVTGSAHEAAISQAVQSAWALAPRFARSAAECKGLTSAYGDASRLGVDRWLAMLAVWTRTRAAFCVANAGTALTFDAVDANGAHQGGVIAPGLSAMVETTLGHTRFPVGEVPKVFDNTLGRDTEACVRQGALHAAAGLLDRLGGQYAGSKVLAGGDAEVLHPQLASDWQIEPHLVLHGLHAWARLASAG